MRSYPRGRFDWVRTLMLSVTLAQPLVQEDAELFGGRDDDQFGALAVTRCGAREILRDRLGRS